MVAYNFKKQFVPLIISGAKLHTIRGHRKRHTRPGEKMQLYTGMRTKHCVKLLNPDPVCVSVEPIVITCFESHQVIIGDAPPIIRFDELTKFAIADGFQSAQQFFNFFETTHGLPFEGVLIRWEFDHEMQVLTRPDLAV